MGLRRIQRRLLALIRKPQMDLELDEEFADHLERQVELNLRLGMNPEEARFAALRSFGGIQQSKEACRDARGIRLIEDLGRDLRYASRMLLKHPGFTIVAILTFALGISVVTTIFSVVDAVIVRPLPFPEAERLVWVGGWGRVHDDREQGVTPADFLDYRAQTESFEQLAASISESVPMNLTDNGDPERIRGALVTADYLNVFGLKPQIGRTFVPQEGTEGANNVAVLGDGLWKRRFGADPGIVNRMITIDGRGVTVIGVMSPQFNYPEGVELWMPFFLGGPPQSPFRSRELHFLRPIAKLKQGVAISTAQAEVETIAHRLEALYPKTNTNQSLFLKPLKERIVGNIRPTLFVLFGAVACILLIAWANVANLFMARGVSRQKEFALRTALGAGRRRVIRQLITESLALSLLGGALGVLLSYCGLKLLMSFAAENLPRSQEIGTGASTISFALGMVVLAAVVFGLAPVMFSGRADLVEALKQGTKGVNPGGYRRRPLNALVVFEVALAVVLLVGAGLFINSFLRLQRVRTGFDETGVLTARIDLPNPFAQPEKKTIFFDQLQQRIAALPGVEAAGMITELPLANQSADMTFKFKPERYQNQDSAEGHADIRNINAEYFRAMHIPLLRGRNFSQVEVRQNAKVIIISEMFAKLFFGGEEALGQRLTFDVLSKEPYEVVGVVGDVRHRGLNIEPRQTAYFPSLSLGYTNLVIRTSFGPGQGDAASLAAALRKEVMALDPKIPVASVKTMGQWKSESISQPRFRTFLLGLFSASAMILAMVGVYGVLAYAVTRRTHEVGIRMALGAQPVDALKLILSQGMSLTLFGLLIGLAVAFALTRLLQNLLFGISARDPLTFCVVAALVTAVAFFACLVPARRATKVDPLVALRCE